MFIITLKLLVEYIYLPIAHDRVLFGFLSPFILIR